MVGAFQSSFAARTVQYPDNLTGWILGHGAIGPVGQSDNTTGRVMVETQA